MSHASPNANSVLELAHGEAMLLAESDLGLRKPIIRALGRLGFTLLVAETGLSAVELFRTHHSKISLVLWDLAMTELCSPEMLTALRRLSPNVPVILSGHSDEVHAHRRYSSDQGYIYLVKPYEWQDLRAAVARYLDTAAKETPAQSAKAESALPAALRNKSIVFPNRAVAPSVLTKS